MHVLQTSLVRTCLPRYTPVPIGVRLSLISKCPVSKCVVRIRFARRCGSGTIFIGIMEADWNHIDQIRTICRRSCGQHFTLGTVVTVRPTYHYHIIILSYYYYHNYHNDNNNHHCFRHRTPALANFTDLGVGVELQRRQFFTDIRVSVGLQRRLKFPTSTQGSAVCWGRYRNHFLDPDNPDDRSRT
jgi:hypothetical protein